MRARVFIITLVAGLLVCLSASALTLTGRASTYGNDPVTHFVDHSDNNRPALSGATNNSPGIAVMNYATLGHWWRVCWLRTDECHWVRQTDIGPARWTGRILDVNAVASRVLWDFRVFPTDVGRWKIRLYGRTLPPRLLHDARKERR